MRAKLVKRAEDYEWSSAKAHVLGIRDNILSGAGWLEEREIDAYREFLKGEDKEIENLIRKATLTGRPFGTEGFVKRLEKILKKNILPKKGR